MRAGGGVYEGLPAKIVQTFLHKYGSARKDILIGIGPHIMAECFEVREDVAQPF